MHGADRQVPGDPTGEGEPGLQDVVAPAAVRPQGAHGEFVVARARSGAARGEGEADAAARFVADDAVADGSVPAVGSDAQGPVEAQRRPGGRREERVARAAHVVEEGPTVFAGARTVRAWASRIVRTERLHTVAYVFTVR
ncbi:hypothetical protein ABTY53_25310 [Streptomyces noursei]|uniref:hypothetical protein n=1 Tax=Streptomyces noursei TaxID=1971 RepID=UPI003328F558